MTATLAQKLRDIADQLDAVDITGLTPTPAASVGAGDLIWTKTDRSIKVDRVEIVKEGEFDRPSLLGFWGNYDTSPEHLGIETRHLAYADEWVVVER